MILLVIFLASLFVAVGAGVLAALSDVRGLIIPNIYSAIVAASFLFAYIVLNMLGRGDVFLSAGSHALATFIVFIITAILFAIHAMGAADLKLATVYALWMGMVSLPVFLFYMTLAGGVLGVIALVLKKWKPVKNPKPGGWVARVQAGESKVPYGVAIVVGALASFVKLGYFSPDVLSSFLMS